MEHLEPSSSRSAGAAGKSSIEERMDFQEHNGGKKDNDVDVVAVSTDAKSGRVSMGLRLKRDRPAASPPKAAEAGSVAVAPKRSRLSNPKCSSI